MTQGTGRWAGAGASAVVVALLVAAWLMMAAPQLLARGAGEGAGQSDERADQPGQPNERRLGIYFHYSLTKRERTP